MKQSDSIALLAAALTRVQQNIVPIVKDRTNPHFGNNYATLDAIMESVRAPLAGEGLSIVQGGGAPVSNVDGNVVGVSVVTTLLHSSGEYLSSTITMPLDKATPQGVGSAITYGRRYGVAALLSLTTEEDDDGNVASAPPVRAAKSAAPSPPGAAARGDAAKKMPFGKHKGEPLGDLTTEELESTVEWCSSDAAKREKFKDLIVACRNVVNARSSAPSTP